MPEKVQKNASQQFLSLYFPYHYEVGFSVERQMRDPRLTQLQNVILWTLHSSGNNKHAMSRKDLEATIGPWFEVTSSALSKSLRGLMATPLELLSLEEHPNSAREKLVSLTPDGIKAVKAMAKRGEKFIDRIVAELTPSEIAEGTRFMTRVSEITKAFSN